MHSNFNILQFRCEGHPEAGVETQEHTADAPCEVVKKKCDKNMKKCLETAEQRRERIDTGGYEEEAAVEIPEGKPEVRGEQSPYNGAEAENPEENPEGTNDPEEDPGLYTDEQGGTVEQTGDPEPVEGGEPSDNGQPDGEDQPYEEGDPAEVGKPSDDGQPAAEDQPYEEGPPSEGGEPNEEGEPSEEPVPQKAVDRRWRKH